MPTYDELDALTTDELRARAYSLAQHRHDIGFFWDVIKHLPAAAAMASEDGSPAEVVGSLAEMVRLAHELTRSESSDLGDAEPLMRERFISYLVQHGEA